MLNPKIFKATSSLKERISIMDHVLATQGGCFGSSKRQGNPGKHGAVAYEVETGKTKSKTFTCFG